MTIALTRLNFVNKRRSTSSVFPEQCLQEKLTAAKERRVIRNMWSSRRAVKSNIPISFEISRGIIMMIQKFPVKV